LLQGFEVLANPNQFSGRRLTTLGADKNELSVQVLAGSPHETTWVGSKIVNGNPDQHIQPVRRPVIIQEVVNQCYSFLKSARVYALEPANMAQAVDSRRVGELSRNGDNLAGALTYLRDQDEEAYDQLRQELQRWLPEFDSIIFKNDHNGYRELSLRQVGSRQNVAAKELSEGTLLALALLTIIYQPNSPTVVGLEEPDRGLHPRLLREVRDALYRLSFPSDFGLKRKPVQVIATTHSPLFLDLFKDHPEQIIIAEKNVDGTASFRNLADDKELIEMIGDTPLGEVWYSGVLGGVPALK
jgi:predicted ATPase